MKRSNSDFIMSWGKFKGKSMEDIPSSYLKWLAEKSDDEDVCEAADAEYEWRTEWDKHWE